MTKMKTSRSTQLALLVALGVLCAATASAQSQTPLRMHSPEILPDRRVTFRLAAPKASEVSLRASWSDAATIPLTRDASGAWSTTVGPLKPDLYHYVFMVDGVRALDPNNAETQRDGARYSNLLAISGPPSPPWEFSDAPHGSIEQIWHPAPVLKQRQRRMYVYLPAEYHTNPSRRYPVLYLIHGGGGDEDSWVTLGRAALILDNQIASGVAAPLIVVMPNGNDEESVSQGYGLGPTPSLQQRNAPPPDPDRYALHAPQHPEPYAGYFPESLVKDIVPFVERTYRVQSDAAHRALAGLSMGAAQTVVIAANNPGMFDYIGVFSGGGMVGEPGFDAQLAALAASGVKLYWTGAGDDDIARLRTRGLYEGAKAKGLPATYRQISGGHTWPVWRDFLADFAPRLFKESSRSSD